jgi:hypothetical protein
LATVGAAVVIALLAQVTGLGGQVLPLLTLGLGVLAYAALVALDVTNPNYVRKVNERGPRVEPLHLVPAAALRDTELRDVYMNILAAFENCQRSYWASSPNVRSSLEDGFGRSQELVKVAGRAAQRSDAIYLQLTATTPKELGAEVERLQYLAGKTSDETARAGFLEAAEAKSNELQTHEQLRGLRDRVHAQLRLIEASLDGLSVKLVKLDATDYTEAISINQSISEHVKTMTNDVEILELTFEDTLKEFHA